ncbi:hypothetical protein LJC25_04245 [Bacteroidales bacterium OttesenSCG-928-K03]|nr:hypothetical protein [Odoribacter sp. OttesenSCG-928-L07]MDL2239409.1 hypothetical protein [Bacteroidales bacterium OttesenSCG-928-L14]MDL2240731.1 hypothetical protein [Bacteroidales bacterium OttesenSCG-928-K22]MDL2242921.1 hypothetical protein [Bacteroidales bacterium OttesenSCG-928-K03]
MKKNIVKRILFVGLIFFSTCTGAFAQKTGLSLHVGGAFPTGEFMTPALNLQHSAVETGNLSTGLSVGLRLNIKLPLGFNVFAHGDFIWNAYDKETKALFNAENRSVPQYYNVPLFVGARYHLSLLKIVGIYGEVGLGADILMKTKEEWGDNLIKYNNSTSFASEYGFGVTLFNRIQVGAHYYLLGNHTISVNHDKSSATLLPSVTPPDHDMKVGMWILKLAVNL